MLDAATLRRDRDAAYRWGALCLLVALATIGGALAIEHVGGVKPCPLCLEQRWAYYLGIPATFVALVLVSTGRVKLGAALLLAVALGYLANAGLGLYHAGVEEKWWAGPATCSGAAPLVLGGAGKGVLGSLTETRVIRCDEAPLRIAGLSLAGWNVIVSLALVAAALKAASGAAESR